MKILIVDDHPILATGLISMLQEHFPDYQFVTCTTLGEAKSILSSDDGKAIKLALCDLLLGAESGVDLLTYTRTHADLRVPIIMLSGVTEPATINSFYEMGAKGYVSKTDNIDVLVQAARKVLAGGEHFPSRDPNRRSPFLDRALKLTERQRTVLDLTIAGLANKEIAGALGIAEGTVKNHLREIMSTLAVNTRTQLGVHAARFGYTPRTRLNTTLRP